MSQTERTLQNQSLKHMLAHVPLEGLRLLIVDDSADFCDLMRVVLARVGADVTVADSLMSASVVLREAIPFDVILTDISLEVPDGGYKLLEFLKLSENTLRHVPCVALTAYREKEEVDQIRAAGFTAHLAKPFVLSDLVDLLLELRRDH